jgi:hypothetical protein
LIDPDVLKRELMRNSNLKILLWLMSGLAMIIVLVVKVYLLKKIYRRTQDPNHFHLNFFGKKVLHRTVAKPLEIFALFVTMPLFLLLGAYFVARIINLILHRHF